MLPAHLRATAEKHIAQLAKRYDIRVRRLARCSWDNSEAERFTRQVFVGKELATTLDYLVVLHEMGHIVDRGAWRSLPVSDSDCLLEEAAAWAWAVKRARPDLMARMTKQDQRRIGMCWASYVGDRGIGSLAY